MFLHLLTQLANNNQRIPLLFKCLSITKLIIQCNPKRLKQTLIFHLLKIRKQRKLQICLKIYISINYVDGKIQLLICKKLHS